MRNYIMASILILFSLQVMSSASANEPPKIVAHRAGTGDAPENTLPAIKKSLENGADAIWITLQLTKDNVPVLYRPLDLKELTNVSGKVRDYTNKQLSTVNAAKFYNEKNKTAFSASIPTLEEVLKLKYVLKDYPNVIFYLDIKSPDAENLAQPFAQALQKVLKETNSFERTRVYSTDKMYLNAIDQINKDARRKEQIQRFESRDETRDALVDITLGHQCKLSVDQKERWYGLEMKRNVELVVVEKFTLGEGRSHSNTVLTWDKDAIDCFRSKGKAYIIFFGINSAQDYEKAKELGADAVMVNSPKEFKKIVNEKK
ncbi:glycerophosphodiester phosphodiesterase family protein [Yersinia nurmii]|uniref:Glycerophosphodiester phosphodiesterase family protein n=1 Tax=Yersinia nurmii TaxID=685706 RepID=A0AAW7K0K1_9GAMM|nr:glycerophosphodiester phosphodiesterase family protein [Yersinia nurmii]MDN0088083.1 glycerophosphodiester phosphodiesterase family protein [Yersinia nurmii]